MHLNSSHYDQCNCQKFETYAFHWLLGRKIVNYLSNIFFIEENDLLYLDV
jgi:hypothetical protein